jgi:hypothetical protein
VIGRRTRKEARNELARCNCYFCNRIVFLAYHTGVLQMNIRITAMESIVCGRDIAEIYDLEVCVESADCNKELVRKAADAAINVLREGGAQ